MSRAPAARARQRGFFDFSVSEIAIIFAVALVVLGPKKLPGLVAQVGRWVGKARHMARQFREQLEQEVNSINAVKPVPRHVPPTPPDVGPPVPPPEVAAAQNSTVPPAEAPDVAQSGNTGEAAAAASAATQVEASPVNEMHPEAQIYFALNDSQPVLVTTNPYAAPAEAATTAAQSGEQADAAPAPGAEPSAATAKPSAPEQPASVAVIFPHDHG